MVEEKWEIDTENLCLDDLVLLEEAGQGMIKVRDLRALLGRLVKNRTEEEIGKLSLGKIRELADKIANTIGEEMTLPKTSDTP